MWVVKMDKIYSLMSYKNTLAWLFLFSVSFGYLEASVVMYLRGLLYPAGFSFPLEISGGRYIFAEYFRELATLLMILSAACVSGKSRLERFAYFMFIFAVWDLIYYAALKILLDWPATIFDPDVLFLIPVPWIAPVLAPVIISSALLTASLYLLHCLKLYKKFYLTRFILTIEITGGLIVILSFIVPSFGNLNSKYPLHFSWFVFSTGAAVSLAAFLYSVFRTVQKGRLNLEIKKGP
jgi:hypothetical protein